MTRTQVTEAAKQLVLAHGPSNCLEFGDELVRDDLVGSGLAATPADVAPLLAEVHKQAHRVYSFLGFDAPAGW